MENYDRMYAASLLLSLSEDGSGTHCEPHTGVFSQTQLSMADIDELERECGHLRDDNVKLRIECEHLMDEN